MSRSLPNPPEQPVAIRRISKHGKAPMDLAEDMDDEELFNLMTQ